MAAVGEIWHRARHDRAFREQLERDPASVLAGVDLDDDELALLDAALRASHPVPAGDLFPLRSGISAEPDVEPAPACHRSPPVPGGDRSADRKEVS